MYFEWLLEFFNNNPWIVGLIIILLAVVLIAKGDISIIIGNHNQSTTTKDSGNTSAVKNWRRKLSFRSLALVCLTILTLVAFIMPVINERSNRATPVDGASIMQPADEPSDVAVTAEPTPTPTPAPTPSPTPVQAPSIRKCVSFIIQTTPKPDDYYKGQSTASENMRYRPQCIMDGNTTTGWTVRGRNGKLTGKAIEFIPADGAQYTVAGFRLLHGPLYSSKKYSATTLFNGNGKLASLMVFCDGEFVETVPIRATKNLETYWLQKPMVGTKFTFQIDGFVLGKNRTWEEDISIAELDLLGANDTGFAHGQGTLDEWGRAVEDMQKSVRSGKAIKKNSKGFGVMGLQVLLGEGFALFDGEANGTAGDDTIEAIERLRERIEAEPALAVNLLPFKNGTVDQNYLDNLLLYLQHMAS